MERLTEEQFQCLLQNMDSQNFPTQAPFDSFFDPPLLPVSEGDFLSFPPLPPIDEGEEALLSYGMPPLDAHESVHSIASSVPEKGNSLELANLKQLQLERQIAQMKLETFEKIKKYHVECLNPWVESVTAALQKLGCMQEEAPASATDGEFEINFTDRS
ncbi:hypothetical protein N7492_002177 [Penicillium capsulatum]|uniref:Uncharacterized protein n=1 Tax=Penicillium capsulatum TaxID=69766 RepID=A0A9W9IJN5_9EURO|nr:hypothetical protein N7492_002177 [Penicillium capsulatum]KAJ6123213.1 hypothetical protein N7512_005678 [Penicillium capsulatum]